MNWLDQLCAFYADVTGTTSDDSVAKVRQAAEFAFVNGREYTVTWDPLDRDFRPKQAYHYANLSQSGLYATPLSVAIPGDALYTQVRCKLPHTKDRALELGAKKKLFGSGWKWKITTNLPDYILEQLKALLLSVESNRPDLYHIHLSSTEHYDRLIVETPVLRGNGSSFRSATEYELHNGEGKLLSVDESAQVIFHKLLTLAQQAGDILERW